MSVEKKDTEGHLGCYSTAHSTVPRPSNSKNWVTLASPQSNVLFEFERFIQLILCLLASSSRYSVRTFISWHCTVFLEFLPKVPPVLATNSTPKTTQLYLEPTKSFIFRVHVVLVLVVEHPATSLYFLS